MNNQEYSIRQELELSRGDNFHSAIATGLGMIPFIGSPIAAFFERAVASPISKRQTNIIIEIFEHLEDIVKKVEAFDLDNLNENEAFASQITQILQIATSTHEKEHLDALRNSALNVAVEEFPDESRRKLFTQWLGELTHWHWKLLHVFKDNRVFGLSLTLNDKDWIMNQALDKLQDIIIDIYPEMEGKYNFSIDIIRDLHSRGLIANHFPHHTMLTRYTGHPELTKTAREFLAFVSHPLDDKD